MKISLNTHIEHALRDGKYWYDVTTLHDGERLTVACDTPRNVGKYLAKLLVSLEDQQIRGEEARAVATDNCVESEEVTEAKSAIAAHTEVCDLIGRLRLVVAKEQYLQHQVENRGALLRLQEHFSAKRAQAIVDLFDVQHKEM